MINKKKAGLTPKMTQLGIREEDLDEQFVRASGPGGQKVNKTSSCVVLRHLPSGLEVRCSRERSQALNRFLARRLLVDKIEEKILGDASRRRQEIEKIRRQKRKRSKRAKEKMLREKKIQGEKKENRKGLRVEAP